MVSKPTLSAEEAQYLSELHAAQHLDAPPRGRWVLRLILALVAAFLGWACLARVDSVTRAEARVLPEGREQVVSSLEGGLLAELLVHEGQRVQAGQALARLDPTRFEAQHGEGEARRLALLATIARLESEAGGAAPRFPPALARHAALQRSEMDALQARRRALDEAVAVIERNAELLQRELRVAEGMSAQGLLSEVEVMRLQRQLNEQKLQVRERINRFRQDAATELLRVRAELAQVEEQQDGRADMLRRTVLTSPVDGLVKNIRTNTVGGVVNAGAAVMEIVPMSRQLLVEARVKPADIGFLRVGQSADLRVSAYEPTLYGGLKGRIEHISPDVLGDTERTAANGADTSYYRVLMRTQEHELRRGSERVPVIPGMTGTLDVRTGERSILSFLVRPLLKANEAFRER